MRHPSYSTRCTPTRHAEFGHRKTHASWTTTTTAINEIQIQKDDRSIASQLFGWFLGFLRDTNQLCESLSTLNRSMERPLRIRSLTWSASPSAGRPCDRSYKAHCWRVSIAALAPYRVQDPILTRGKHFKMGDKDRVDNHGNFFFFWGFAECGAKCACKRHLRNWTATEMRRFIRDQPPGRRQTTEDRRQTDTTRESERERERASVLYKRVFQRAHSHVHIQREWEGESARETHTKEDKSTRYRTRSICSTHVRGSLATTAATTTTRTSWEASTMRYEKLTDR